MKISYNWLRNYLPTDLTHEAVADILTRIGLEVEGGAPYCAVRGGLEGLIVGEVLTCDPHPNADRLKLTRVSVGEGEPLQIVCGAPNVAAGQHVVVAAHGTRLYPLEGEPFVIKRAKVRGEVSEGMICAEDEIGLGHSHDGIIVLPAGAQAGTPVAQWLGVESDYVFEIGLTANRADAMSHYGVARDLAAYLNLKHRTRAELPTAELGPLHASSTAIVVGTIDSTACTSYHGITIRGVKVSDSPEWLQNRLRSIGLNPINCVVDVTNFVLHEMGQPLHAFDTRAFTTGQVSVKKLPAATPFETLDGRERKLDPEDLLVCDGDTPLCLAGVLGGRTSGVSAETTDIFLESAVFNPVLVRKSAKRHAISTDASYRFERGVDPALTPYALARAASLILDVAGGHIDGEPVAFSNGEDTGAREITFDPQAANRLMGLELDEDTMLRIFEGLEIESTPVESGKLLLRVPRYRVDVARQEDVIEEILRLHGYDAVPVDGRVSYALPMGGADSRIPEAEEQVARVLIGKGYYEVMSLSLTPGERIVELGICPSESLVRVQNPLSGDLDSLRPTLLWGALEAVARNATRQRPDLQLFEFGVVHRRKEGRGGDTLSGFEEHPRLALTLSGMLGGDTWTSHAQEVDVFTLKGHVEALLRMAAIEPSALTYAEADTPIYSYGSELMQGKQPLGHFGCVRNAILSHFGIKSAVYYAELDWNFLARNIAQRKGSYDALPKFPEVRRDLALLLDESVRFADLQTLALQAEPRLLRSVELFDVYEGDKIPAGKKSYAISFVLQDEWGTLTDKAIEIVMARILEAIVTRAGAELRA